jgi:hypothetical protein
MYSYYRDASVCIIYLADVPGLTEPDMGADKEYWLYRFKNSRWFTRGWTLQELIAPKRRIWLARDWSVIDPAEFLDPNAKFLDTVASVTGIGVEVLKDRTTMSQFCIAERMSWASARRTTRPEDAAYSLLGLFGINMAVLYGEGLEHAFARLQGEIMKTSFDQTIFAWRGPYSSSGLLAHSPADFARTPKLGLWGRAPLSPFSMTNVGLHIRPVIAKTLQNGILLAVLQCDITDNYSPGHGVAVRLQRVEETRVWLNGTTREAFRRVNCDKLDFVSDFPGAPYVDLLVLEDKHAELLDVAKRADDSRWGRIDQDLELVTTPTGGISKSSGKASLERSQSEDVISPARSNTDMPVSKRKWKWSSFTSMSNLSSLNLNPSKN